MANELTPEQLKAKQEAEAAAAKAKTDAEAQAKADKAAAEEAARQPVLVDNKEQRLVVVHHSQSGALLTKVLGPNDVLTAEQAAEELMLQKPVNIVPGLHPYRRRVWDAIRNHPHVKNLLADGLLVVQTKAALGQALAKGEDMNTTAKSLPKTLANVAVQVARDLADGVQDKVLLKMWLDGENLGQRRQSVVDALQTQLDRISENDKKFEAAKN